MTMPDMFQGLRDAKPNSVGIRAFSTVVERGTFSVPEWAHHMRDLGRKMLLEDGELMSVVHVAARPEGLPPDRVLLATVDVSAFMKTGNRKDALSEALPKILGHLRAFAFMMATEVWYWEATSPEESDAISNMSYEARHALPSRREMVLFTLERHAQPSSQWGYVMRRDAEGKLVSIDDQSKYPESVGMMGRFTDCLMGEEAMG